MENNDGQIIQLLDSYDDSNIELAFQLAKGIGLENLSQSLKENLVSFKVTCLREWPELLKNEEVLILERHQLEELPKGIVQMQKLDLLILQSNYLKELPKDFGRLKSLRALNLENNQLTKLPESIGELKNLEILNLYNNQIIELPESLSKLQNLQRLYLSGNPICITLGDRGIKRIEKTLPNLFTLEVSPFPPDRW